MKEGIAWSGFVMVVCITLCCVFSLAGPLDNPPPTVAVDTTPPGNNTTTTQHTQYTTFPAGAGPDIYNEYITQVSWTNVLRMVVTNPTIATTVITVNQDSAEIWAVDVSNTDVIMAIDTNNMLDGKWFRFINTAPRTSANLLRAFVGPNAALGQPADRLAEWSAGRAMSFIFSTNGTWYPGDNASYVARSGWYDGVGMGDEAVCHLGGVAAGYQTDGRNNGFAGGYGAVADGGSGVQVGVNGDIGGSGAVGVGALTRGNDHDYAIALGYRGANARPGELRVCWDISTGRRTYWSVCGWHSVMTAQVAAAQTEIFLKDGTSRWTVQPESATKYNGDCVITDEDGNFYWSYSFEGLICRDGANNTTLPWANVTTDYTADATIEFVPSVDDVNEALVIKVKPFTIANTNKALYINATILCTEAQE